jgi:hypothetical protein
MFGAGSSVESANSATELNLLRGRKQILNDTLKGLLSIASREPINCERTEKVTTPLGIKR